MTLLSVRSSVFVRVNYRCKYRITRKLQATAVASLCFCSFDEEDAIATDCSGISKRIFLRWSFTLFRHTCLALFIAELFPASLSHRLSHSLTYSATLTDPMINTLFNCI